MFNLLITGASGFIGQNLLRFFRSRYSTFATNFNTQLSQDLETSIKPFQLDIRDDREVSSLFDQLRPNIVIHAAGNKDVKYCEMHPDEAFHVNSLGTQNVARACCQIGARMIYISTDLVFSCKKGGYRETDTPQPALVYGKTKLQGEYLAMQELEDIVICRSGGVYGRGSPLLRWLSEELQAGQRVECFTDVFNTPTYVENLGEMIQAIIQKRLTGIFHTVGQERVNRYQFFRTYATLFGLDANLLHPSPADERKGKLLLQTDSSLSQEYTTDILGITSNSVAEGMARLRDSMEW